MTGTASLQISRGDAAIVPPPSKGLATAPTREAIGIVRILCILGIVYVHAWTGRTGEDLHAYDETAQGVLRWVLIELVGRSAVPLLGAISGWLSGPSAAKRGYGGFVAVKARTILAPMLLWNVIALVLVSGFATFGTLKAPVPGSIREALDWIGCVTQPNPINVQISFLRDLFLCMCAAPLLARLSVRWLWVVWGVALVWSIVVVPWPILLRPPILLFFVTGMLARRAGLAERIATWPLWACVTPYLLLVPVKIWLSAEAENWWLAHVAAANAIDLPMRFAAALALWRVALAIAPNTLGRLLLRGERYAFLLFCCHLALIWLIGPLIGHAVGALGAPAYPAYLLLQPALALGATVLLAMTLERISRHSPACFRAVGCPSPCPNAALRPKGRTSPPELPE